MWSNSEGEIFHDERDPRHNGLTVRPHLSRRGELERPDRAATTRTAGASPITAWTVGVVGGPPHDRRLRSGAAERDDRRDDTCPPLFPLGSSPPARDPACPVMSEALSLPSCLPPRSSVWSRLPPPPSRRLTVTHDCVSSPHMCMRMLPASVYLHACVRQSGLRRRPAAPGHPSLVA